MTFLKKKFKTLIVYKSYLIYSLPFFLGLGAFIPNVIYTILTLSFILLLINKSIKISDFNNIFFKLFIIFWLISVLSSFFSEDISMSMLSSVSYLRFIIFAMLTYWLIKNQYLDFNLFFKIVLYSLTAILFFAYVELITGYNVILDDLKDIFQDGFKNPRTRITGLFGDEQVLGGYLLRILLFALIIFFYNENKISKRIKTYFLFLIFSSLLFIVFSGERSSIVMLIISLFLAALMINGYKNIKLLFIFSFILSFIAIILIKPNIYNRLITQTFYLQVYSLEKNKIYFFSKTHEAHYQTALNIFLDKPILGAGNKSFRLLCSQDKYSYNIIKFDEGERKGQSQGCATHPHNFYLQVLSENGLINLFLLLFFYFFIIKNICFYLYKKILFKEKIFTNTDISIYIFFSVLLWPVIPTGSFFSSWIASTLFLPMGFLIYNKIK